MAVRSLHALGVVATIGLTMMLTACGEDDGPKVFSSADVAVKGLEDIRFGQSCEDVNDVIADAGYTRHLEEDRSKGSGLALGTVGHPLIGSAEGYLSCDDKDRLEEVYFISASKIDDFAPYERTRGQLEQRFGSPSDEGQFQKKHLMSQRNLTLRYVKWVTDGQIGYELKADLNFTDVHLFLFITPPNEV